MKHRNPYWLIPIGAVLLIFIGTEAYQDPVTFGLLFGTVFSLLGFFMVYLFMKPPAPTEKSQP